MPVSPRLAILLAPLLLATSACGGGARAASDRTVQVVAGENFWGDIASQIGGTHARVTSIISDPGTDPHDYESDPDDAAALARAEVVIENGAGYDDFLVKLIDAAGTHLATIDVATLVGATATDANPHLWYSPTYVTQAAAEIERQLAEADPADREEFAANLATFRRAYAPYSALLARIRASYSGTAIAYTERVPGYLVAAAGLRLGTPAAFSQAVEDGTDPSPQSTQEFDQAITEHHVSALLYNAQVVDAQTTAIKSLATSSGVPIVGVSETIPQEHESFQAWQIAQAQSLLVALGG